MRLKEEDNFPKDTYIENEQGPAYYLGTDHFSILEQHSGSDLGPTYLLSSKPPEINPLTDVQPDIQV